MPAILAMILPLLAQLPGAIGQYFKQKNDLEAARIETERQIEIAKQTLASDLARAQVDLAKTALNATSSGFKYFTFVMWFGPFMVGLVAPKLAQDIFANLAGMPEWYVQSCILIMFTIWGISISAPVVGNIMTGLSSFISNRRDYKLEKARIDRAKYFDIMRKLEGPLTQDAVNQVNKVLDEMEK